MARLRELAFKSRYQTYGMGDASVVDSFYVPVLSVAKKYDRLSGFFSSASFSLAAEGVAGMIANGGRMRLICSPILSPGDIEILRNPKEALSAQAVEGYFADHFQMNEQQIKDNHVAALAWMLANKMLEIKLAVVTDDAGRIKPDSLFHPKVGLVTDAYGDSISFSGSNNETASGWTSNQEEFKVFASWNEGHAVFFEADRRSFNDYWSGNVRNIACFDIPSAFKERLIRESDGFSKEEYIRRHFESRQKRWLVWKRLNLFDYQKAAIAKWDENGRALLFEMATGAGKTRCAIGCVNRLIESAGGAYLCVVIAVPTNDLCVQWEREIDGCLVDKFKLIVANSKPGHLDWRSELSKQCSRFMLGTTAVRTLVVLTTHTTASSIDFMQTIGELSKIAKAFLIADEVHGMGASEHKKGLLKCYDYKLGLSATPERMFDDQGTELIRKYFGDEKFEFTLRDALHHDRVCPYSYHPVIISLSEDENEKYVALSEKIRKLSGPAQADPGGEADERLKQLLIERSKIIAAAKGKIPVLKGILQDNMKRWRSHVLAFACDRNFDDCLRCMVDCGVRVSPYTFRQKDRDGILKGFARGELEALLAMKCLDEGIDVPDAHVAILVSSSTNPREYIQRIGRVIRKAQGKAHAEIYDFLVMPNAGCDDIIERDFKRGAYIASSAINAFEASEILFPHIGKVGV